MCFLPRVINNRAHSHTDPKERKCFLHFGQSAIADHRKRCIRIMHGTRLHTSFSLSLCLYGLADVRTIAHAIHLSWRKARSGHSPCFFSLFKPASLFLSAIIVSDSSFYQARIAASWPHVYRAKSPALRLRLRPPLLRDPESFADHGLKTAGGVEPKKIYDVSQSRWNSHTRMEVETVSIETVFLHREIGSWM